VALEALDWPDEPANTDAEDPGQSYNMGIRFADDDGGPCVGVQWRVPDTAPAPAGGVHAVAIWDAATSTRVAYEEFTPVPGGYQDVLFVAPPTLDPAPAEYVAVVYTFHYTFRASGGAPVSSVSGKLNADEGRLADYNGGSATAPFPTNVFNTWYYVSPLMDRGGADPAEGQAALGLDLAVAATGGADAEGAAAVGLGLAVAATGGAAAEGQAALGLNLAVAAQGSSPAGGTVALTLGLAPAATGERASLGAAALNLNLAVSGSGLHAASGTATLGLNLAVSATGSNGDVGCPVPAFPFASSPVSGYPWTARPVKSFPGGDC
jgi:hypothetical protein